ncbi:MAG: alpha/beta hydrolase, partial [Pseudomonadota bacterium]
MHTSVPRPFDKIPHEMVATNGLNLHAAVLGDGPLVILVHGFPESWYSWRHQIEPIAEAGFKVAAIDVRGYGGSDKPHPINAYTYKEITSDIVGVADALGAGKAILVGHDWGALLAWHTALLHPDTITAVCGLSIPYIGRLPAPYIDIAKKVYTSKNRFFYQVYFQEEGVAEAELEADIRGSLRRFFYAHSGDAPLGAWPTNKPQGARLLDGVD